MPKVWRPFMRGTIMVLPIGINSSIKSICCFLAVVLPVVFFPTVLVAFAVNALVDLPPAYSENQSVLRKLMFGVLFAPWAETLLLGWFILQIRKITTSYSAIALISATTWSIFHSMAVVYWGFVVFWPFLVFSLTFLAWEKVSSKCALIVVTLLHASHNLLILLLSTIWP